MLLQRKKEETKLASIKLYSRLALKKILRNMLWEYQSVVGFPCPSKPTEGKKLIRSSWKDLLAFAYLQVNFLCRLSYCTSKERVYTALPLHSFRAKVSISHGEVSIGRYRTILFVSPQVSVHLTVTKSKMQQVTLGPVYMELGEPR